MTLLSCTWRPCVRFAARGQQREWWFAAQDTVTNGLALSCPARVHT